MPAHRPHRSRAVVIVAALAVGAAALPAAAKPLTLPELIEIARRANPGVLASAASAGVIEAQLHEARWNWFPSGELNSYLTAVPRIQCRGAGQADVATQMPPVMVPGPDGQPKQVIDNTTDCVSTNADPLHNPGILAQLAGPWTRTEVRLVQPLWDFGKISAGSAAAEAGLSALHERQAGTAADVELNVRKAYWGWKLAKALESTLDEGLGYLDDAQKRVEKQLADGTGSVTITDRLRLRVVRAEVEARSYEVKRLAALASAGLRTLLGAEAPANLEIDDEDFEPLTIPTRPVSYYEEQARWNRPEVRALSFAVRAKWALSDLERRRAYPDLVLVATGSYAYAPTIDAPKSAFLSNPYNSFGAGVVAVLRMQLDLGPKIARAQRTRAEAEETDLRRAEALGGIALEVRKAYAELTDAEGRVASVEKGTKAGKAWITAVAQSFALGLAEARDFSDALTASFQMRARFLQSVYDLNVAAAALARATGAAVP